MFCVLLYLAIVSGHIFNLMLQFEVTMWRGPAGRWFYAHIQFITYYLTLGYLRTVWFNCREIEKA